jgi:hypothetical protein
MRSKLTLSTETLRVLDDDDLTRVVGGGDDHNHDKHNPGSRGSGSGPSGDGPPGCASKSGAASC